MPAGNVSTALLSPGAGEEVWAGPGAEAEGLELPTFSTAAKVRVGVTAVLFVSSATGNLAVLWSVTRPQSSPLRPSPLRRLFAHLAAADLLVTFVVMPLDATWNVTVQWLAGDVACRTLMFLKLVAMYAAAFLPVVIGLDRQAAVVHPLGPRSGGRKLLGAAWGLSFLLALPQGERDLSSCNLSLFSTFPARVAELNLRRSSDNRPRVRLRALRLALLVLLTFVLCWAPYYLLGLWYWFSPAMLTQVPPSLSHILFLFGLLNAPLDPLLYGAFTLGCRRGNHELSVESSKERGSGKMTQQEIQVLRHLEAQADVAARIAGETKETLM